MTQSVAQLDNVAELHRTVARKARSVPVTSYTEAYADDI